MQNIPIGGVLPTNASQPASNTSGQEASDAFGLNFESLLQIVLTQLTFQDPLKPVENAEFVSQLAQFSQIQQTQSMVDSLETLVAAQSTSQAASLLGRQVDIPAGGTILTGSVTAVSFANGSPSITIETDDGQTISGISLNSVSQIREGN